MNLKNENILDQSIQFLKSVGPKRAEAFKQIGIETIRDILFYFPSKHLDRTTTLSAAKAYGYVINGYDGELTIIAKVVDKEKRRFRNKEIMKIQFKDSSGFFECVWFQGAKYFYTVFNEGDIFAVSGKPTISKYGNLQFAHPDFDRISEEESNNFLNTGKIIPFYRIPKELRSKNIGDFSLRKIISGAVENYADYIQETLPDNIINDQQLLGITESVKNLHFPETKEKYKTSLDRFKFEEIFYFEILAALKKHNYKTELKGHSIKVKSDLVSNFLKTLPFQLTKAQLKVLHEIKIDMENKSPMNRLLQGDVGSGKTIVSLISMLIAVDNGYQAVLMAPTEILADQHAKNISKMLKKLSEVNYRHKIKTVLLLGGQKKSIKELNLQNIELQEADIIVGTHALFEAKVKFKNLGLVIVDEQHRFGVAQRARLQSKGITPDVLVMSATPIPRTLSMTIYGDLDVSVIDQMPKSRKPIKTVLRGEDKLPEIYKFIKDKNKQGYQSFIVYPLVEESDKVELKAAEAFYNELSAAYLKDLNVGLIHGRMSWQKKEEVMQLFLTKRLDVLISTTVIEVGIDIPAANIILINDAHRFGLSQLHQLRGRIGRGNDQAYCILVTKSGYLAKKKQNAFNLDFMPPAQIEKHKASIRLNAMTINNDGFKIAEIDMKLRGPGDIFGIEQSGFPELKFINLINDTELITTAKIIAFKLIEDDPLFEEQRNTIVKENLFKYYKSKLQYSNIA